MSCKHHPKYDPAAGEPTDPIYFPFANAPSKYGEFVNDCDPFPCPYCWQARAKWLDADNTRLRKLDTKRIDKLETDLVNCVNQGKKLDKQLASKEAILKMIEFPCYTCKKRDRADALYLCYGCKHYFCEVCAPIHFDGVQEAEKREAVLVEALQFYGDLGNYIRIVKFNASQLDEDNGKQARAAIKASKEVK